MLTNTASTLLDSANTAAYWIERLELEQHPEGGYFKRFYQSKEKVSDKELSVRFQGHRYLSTSIIFLLPSNEVSRFHRLKSDEIWYYQGGSSLTLCIIDPNGQLQRKKLGLNLNKGESPQVVVPGNSIFGAYVNKENSFTLLSCMVSPGFDYTDFEIIERRKLLERYPHYRSDILRLTGKALPAK